MSLGFGNWPPLPSPPVLLGWAQVDGAGAILQNPQGIVTGVGVAFSNYTYTLAPGIVATSVVAQLLAGGTGNAGTFISAPGFGNVITSDLAGVAADRPHFAYFYRD